jgi:anti-anti-sigma factor
MAMNVEASRTDLATIVRVNGRVDGGTAPELERVCHEWISPGDRNMILDFSGLEYISSAGLGSVLSAGKALDAQGGRLVLCGLTGRLKQIFLFSGFDALFPIFESRDAAVADCAQIAELLKGASSRGFA